MTLAIRAAALYDPALMGASTRRVEEGLAAHRELFATLMHLFGRRMRPPFTLDHLVAVIAAMAEGFAVQDCTRRRHPRIRRQDLGEGVGDDWTLFGTAVQFVIEAFTEDDPAPERPGVGVARTGQTRHELPRPESEPSG
jgi:hypothetical protein